MKRIFLACIGGATNTFSSVRVDTPALSSAAGGGTGRAPAALFDALQDALRIPSATGDWQCVAGPVIVVPPAGPIAKRTCAALREQVLQSLVAVPAVDAVLLCVPGSLIDVDGRDCAGELVAAIRAQTGSAILIGILAAGNALLSPVLLSGSDVTLFASTGAERATAATLVTLIQRTLAGELRPVAAVHDCHRIMDELSGSEAVELQHTMARIGQDSDIECISIAWGSRWADTVSNGTKVIAIAHDAPQKSLEAAREIGILLERAKEASMIESIERATDAIAMAPRRSQPHLIADTGDNPANGSAGDRTDFLAYLLNRRAARVALGPLCDPLAVRTCAFAGAGALLTLRIGGKQGCHSGMPIDLRVQVVRLAARTANDASVDAAVVRPVGYDSFDILLTTCRKEQPEPSLYTSLGIDLASKRMVVVKSGGSNLGAFAGVTGEIWQVASPGATTCSPSYLRYGRLQPQWGGM